GIIEMPFDAFNAVLITAFFLVSAVRNIAPIAENHGFFARLLPTLAMLPAPFAELFSAHALALRQLTIAGVFLMFVLLFELASTRLPMASHWRAWRRGGPVVRTTGRCSLPGWQSALLFAVFAAGLWTLLALVIIPTGSVPSRGKAEDAALVALLGLAGLVAPPTLQSYWRGLRLPAVALYFLGLVLPALLAGVALALAESRWHFTALRTLMEMLPFSSFLFALGATPVSNLVAFARLALAVAVLAAA